jgi:hypothetical protein
LQRFLFYAIIRIESMGIMGSGCHNPRSNPVRNAQQSSLTAVGGLLIIKHGQPKD